MSNNVNHFAMVENFVEKYIPVRIQSQISQTLQQCLPYKEVQQLAEYERAKFKEMHQSILDDDGKPDLLKNLRDIRFNMKDIDFDNYQSLTLLDRNSRPQLNAANTA